MPAVEERRKMEGNGTLTPTQRRMMAVLEDGALHTRQELHACLDDELAPVDGNAIPMHICKLRRLLRPFGRDIAFHRVARVGHYQIVRTTSRVG